jgi:hypothetical protein
MNRAIKDEDLTKTVALYSGKYHTAIFEVEGWIEEHKEYVRVTEPVEVTFTPLPDEVVLEGRVKAIDNEITKTRAELTQRINDLTDQKNRLLAITHEPVE